jgi:hypothetical protein
MPVVIKKMMIVVVWWKRGCDGYYWYPVPWDDAMQMSSSQ